MNNRKKVAYSLLFLGIFFVGIATGYFFLKLSDGSNVSKPNTESLRKAQAQIQTSPTQSPTPKELYFVKSDKEKVGIYIFDKTGNPVLQYHTEQININALREQERKRLIEGITVHGKEELASLMEDFSS